VSRNEPTISSILRELADQFTTIVSERDVYNRVLERRPSRAKDPYASIREQLRFGAPRLGWVWLGGGQLVPLRVAQQGMRFRIIPSEDEFAGDLITKYTLRPFVPYGDADIRLEDAQGHALPIRAAAMQVTSGIFGPLSLPAVDLGAWFRTTKFEPGDSILCTIVQAEPLSLRIEREPAAQFRAAEVVPAEQELLDALVERIGRGGRNSIVCEDSVLPIYARAAWRTSYPGRPWQRLVEADKRLRLVDGDYIADASFRRPLDWIFGDDRDESYWQKNDAELLDAITQFQAELLASRRESVERGLWNGIAPRISTARTIFDMQERTAETIYPGAVNVLQDHSADIEEHIARGDYQDESWVDDDDEDIDDLDLDDEEFDFDDELLDIDDIEDVQSFLEQNPALGEATRQLMDSLSPQEIEQLQEAETIDDVQRILSGRLTDLLRTNPGLFVPLEPPTEHHSNGSTNGNGHKPDADSPSLDDEDWEEDLILGEEWEEAEGDNELRTRVAIALERSNELMEQFYRHQIASGKSEATAENRTRDLWIYADFLANYYGRSLQEGDYATLDECLFYYYPRKVINNSPRAAREMCTSTKQFYSFLKAQGTGADDSFAIAIWKRRDQAARVIELYEQLDPDSPQFERLFAHLFSPYTA
jgi:hypothetical protein